MSTTPRLDRDIARTREHMDREYRLWQEDPAENDPSDYLYMQSRLHELEARKARS